MQDVETVVLTAIIASAQHVGGVDGCKALLDAACGGLRTSALGALRTQPPAFVERRFGAMVEINTICARCARCPRGQHFGARGPLTPTPPPT